MQSLAPIVEEDEDESADELFVEYADEVEENASKKPKKGKAVLAKSATGDVKRVKKDKRGLVVLSETYHALGISRGLYSYDVLVDKKIAVRKYERGKWFPERDGHLKP